jgi:hypothetical protein
MCPDDDTALRLSVTNDLWLHSYAVTEEGETGEPERKHPDPESAQVSQDTDYPQRSVLQRICSHFPRRLVDMMSAGHTACSLNNCHQRH